VKNDDEKMDMVDGEMVNEKWMNELYTSPPHYSYQTGSSETHRLKMPLKKRGYMLVPLKGLNGEVYHICKQASHKNRNVWKKSRCVCSSTCYTIHHEFTPSNCFYSPFYIHLSSFISSLTLTFTSQKQI